MAGCPQRLYGGKRAHFNEEVEQIQMLSHPRISVIMSVYNGERYLREAIESILNQTFADFEFIIVNDASTDSSLAIIQSYQDERIRVISNEINIGLTKSLNKAITEARGEYIARQDADDISLPNRFEEQIKYFEHHPETALLGTSKYVIDEDGKILRKAIVLLKTSKDLLKTNAITHGSAMFKKAIIDELGGYNELVRYSQDYELWLRIAKHHDVRSLRQILYKLRYHSENVRLTNVEESTLYIFLIRRLADNNLGEELLRAIKEKGIRSLIAHLSKKERIYFHKTVADAYVRKGNMKLAREEYKKVFNLTRFDIKNDINIIRSYLGRTVMIKSSKLYETIRNYYVYFENWYSR